MEIATILHSHGDTNTTLDTLESIRVNVGNKIILLIDGCSREWGETLPFQNKVYGIPHGTHASYRNVAYGLQQASRLYDVDWYCYCEYDVVFVSDKFKDKLNSFPTDVWCVGNDLRYEDFRIPFLEMLFKKELFKSVYILGCCVFYAGEFVRKIDKLGIFDYFLSYCNFSLDLPGYRSRSTNIRGYDLSEHLYPTLAAYMGGKIECFSYAKSNGIGHMVDNWDDNFKHYTMRFRPELLESETSESIIAHPVKTYGHPFREKLRQQRGQNVF